MPFQVQCMFCGHRSQVPDSAYGASGRCRKCANSFTLVPAETTVPLPARSSHTRRTRRTRPAALPQEPLPVAPDSPLPPAEPSPIEQAILPAPPPEPDAPLAERSVAAAVHDLPDEDDAPAAPRRRTHPLGFVALAAVAAALWCASSLTLCPFVLPAAGAGILFGLAGLLLEDAGSRWLVPAGAAAAGGVVALTAWLTPSLLGPAYRLSRQGAAPDLTTIRVVPLEEGLVSNDPEWVDASKAALQQGKLRVQVVSAAVSLEKEKQSPKKKPVEVLTLRLRTQRGEVAAKRLEKIVPRLTDTAGKEYSARVVEAPPAAPRKDDRRKAVLFPVTVQEEVFVFEAPPSGAAPLRLEIPAAPWGGPGAFRFIIPAAMIRQERGGP
jgi:hypothetical protein